MNQRTEIISGQREKAASRNQIRTGCMEKKGSINSESEVACDSFLFATHIIIIYYKNNTHALFFCFLFFFPFLLKNPIRSAVKRKKKEKK